MMIAVLIFILVAVIAFCVASRNPKNLVAKTPPVLNIPERFKWKPKEVKVEYTFDEECHETNVAAFWFPFLLTFFITAIWFNMKLPLIGTLFSLFVSLLVGSIGMSIGHSVNIARAEERGISPDDPRVQYEMREKKLGYFYTALTLADLMYHSKKAIDDVANVNGWEKTK